MLSRGSSRSPGGDALARIASSSVPISFVLAVGTIGSARLGLAGETGVGSSSLRLESLLGAAAEPAVVCEVVAWGARTVASASVLAPMLEVAVGAARSAYPRSSGLFGVSVYNPVVSTWLIGSPRTN